MVVQFKLRPLQISKEETHRASSVPQFLPKAIRHALARLLPIGALFLESEISVDLSIRSEERTRTRETFPRVVYSLLPTATAAGGMTKLARQRAAWGVPRRIKRGKACCLQSAGNASLEYELAASLSLSYGQADHHHRPEVRRHRDGR
jgi:hypothetical protein